MATTAASNDQSILDQIIDFFVTITQLIYYIIVGSVRALLPSGLLPRKSVENNVVLITGSGSGLGRLMAVRFAQLGAKLVLWDVNEKGNLETKKIVSKITKEVYAYTIDLSSHQDIAKVAERVKSDVGGVDILINNAGIVTGKKLFDCPDELMEKTMAVNTNANFYTTKAFLPRMLSNNHGHVVVVASMAGLSGVAGLVDYCASKYGAVGFAEALSAEVQSLGKSGVHVTTVCPYFIDTGMFDGVKTFSPNLLPILQPDYVIDRIMEAILTNSEKLYMPRFGYISAFAMSFLPAKAGYLLSSHYGINRTMDEFKGRHAAKRAA